MDDYVRARLGIEIDPQNWRTSKTAIHSFYEGQEDWVELLQEFVSDIPERIATIQAAVASENVESLRYLMHQLRGACGSNGFDEVTPLANHLEIAICSGTSVKELMEKFDQFIAMLASLTAEPAS